MGYVTVMGRWITITVVILLLVAGTSWLLKREGVENCNDRGGDWDYARWACDT